MSKTNCSIALIGTRWYICIAHDVFPVDRMSHIDTAYPCWPFGIKILLSKPEQELVWTKESDAKVIRKFLFDTFGLNVASEDSDDEESCCAANKLSGHCGCGA